MIEEREKEGFEIEYGLDMCWISKILNKIEKELIKLSILFLVLRELIIKLIKYKIN